MLVGTHSYKGLHAIWGLLIVQMLAVIVIAINSADTRLDREALVMSWVCFFVFSGFFFSGEGSRDDIPQNYLTPPLF